MRKHLPWLVAVLAAALALGVSLSAPTSSPPKQIPAPQLKAHPCVPGDWYMQCKAVQPNLLSPPNGEESPGTTLPRSGAVFGLDFAWGGPSGAFARARGAYFGCSYLSWSSKDWTYGLLHSYSGVGSHACFVWETAQYRALDGYWAGYSDARAASAELARLGAAGARVEFGYDFDTSGRGCASICPYLQGADRAIGRARVGVYGGLNTVSTAFNAGVISGAWQTLAWSGGRWDPRACIRQVSINNTWFGYSVDHDFVVCGNTGFWPSSPPPKPRPRYPVCLHKRVLSPAQCRALKVRMASQRRALRATGVALYRVRLGLHQHHCRKPYRRRVCVALGHYDKTLTQRYNYFWNKLWTENHRY